MSDTWRSQANQGFITRPLPLNASTWKELTDKEKKLVMDIITGVFDSKPRSDRDRAALAALKAQLWEGFGSNLFPGIAAIPLPGVREGIIGIGPAGGLNLCGPAVLTQACQASLKKANDLIGKLGDEAFAARVKANRDLDDLIAEVAKTGTFACLSELRARLVAASRGKDPETNQRVKGLLGKLDSLIGERPAPSRPVAK